MRNENMGKVVPFTLSARRMRQGAETYSRRGQLLEAVELTRRAAEEEDSASGWLRLEQLLRKAGCFEQAATLLARVLTEEDAPPAAWLEMALCQRTLTLYEGAADSLMHCIHEDPYGPEADEARAILSDLEPEAMERESIRVPLMLGRGMDAWREGRKELAVRRLKRAARLDRHPERIESTIALMLLADQDHDGALKALMRALRAAPDDPRPACMACVVLYGAGKKRAALGMLRQWARKCNMPGAEQSFITAAQTISARRELRDYLSMRLKENPYRIELMHIVACNELDSGNPEQAMQWWQRILRLDPSDYMARTMLQWTREHPDEKAVDMGTIVEAEDEKQFAAVERRMLAGERMEEREYLPGSAFRSLMDWHMLQNGGIEQTRAAGLLCGQASPGNSRYLKELLTLPRIGVETQQMIMEELARRGEADSLLVRIGPNLAHAQSAQAEQKPRKLWKLFLWQVIMEAGGDVSGLVEFAARVWRTMTPEERQWAAGVNGYSWVRAVVIFYLSMTDREAAVSMAMEWPVSPRRIARVIRRIAMHLGIDTQDGRRPSGEDEAAPTPTGKTEGRNSVC